jgi:hypothetical protein
MISCPTASFDGKYHPRFPHGDAPHAALAGAASDVVSGAGALGSATSNLALTNASLPNATQQVEYQGSATLVPTGGSGTGYVISILSQSGPNNTFTVLQLSPGVTPWIVEGTPQFGNVTTSITFLLKDSANNSVTKTLTIFTAAVPFAIQAVSPLANAIQGIIYSGSIPVRGGVPPYLHSPSAPFPNTGSWLRVNPDGTYGGTPGTIETESFTDTVTDASGGANAPISKTFSVQVAAPTAPSPTRFISPNGDDSNDGLTLATAWSITAFSSRKSSYAGQVIGIVGDTGNNLSGFAITGTSGQFSCAGTAMKVGQRLRISGTFGGSGSIAGYVSGMVFYITATNGSTTGTLATEMGAIWGVPLVTTPGTPTGITCLLNTLIQQGTASGVSTTLFSLYQSAPTLSSGPYNILPVQGGPNGASPTYIMPCDSTGAYLPRWATIDCSNPSTGAPPTFEAGVFGQNVNQSGLTAFGNVTYDALTIRNFTFNAICMFGTSTPNVVVKNCEIYGGGNVSSSNNPGAVWLFNADQALLTNNYFHDLATTAGGEVPGGLSAMITFQSTNTEASYNTTFNCGPSFYAKDHWQSANVHHNYFDIGNFGSIGTGGVLGSCVERSCPGAGMQFNVHHNIMLGGASFRGASNNSFISGTVNCYNNTIYLTANCPNGGRNLLTTQCTSSTVGTVNFYNNLTYQEAGTINDLTMNCFNDFGITAATGGMCDYNTFASGNKVQFGSFQAPPGVGIDTNLSTWQANGHDTHSITLSSRPYVGGAVPTSKVPSTFALNPASAAYTGGITAPGGAAGQIMGAVDQFGNASDGSGRIGVSFP